ncbi:MAG: alanyl-tRNA editing protein [bacterium]
MPEKLATKEPYVKEFEALVQKIDADKIILDKTYFYPESGGQVGDTGYLNQAKVVGTKYDANKENILHFVEGQPDFKEGDRVVGKIDWERRYKIMKLHAASHVMEHYLFEVFGKLKLVGTQVNEKHDSSTYEYPNALEPEKLKQVEKLVNEFISKGYVIERWEDPNKPGWWHWKAGEIELPCGGTHPKSLNEIGPVTIKRKSSGSEKEKVLTSLVEQTV